MGVYPVPETEGHDDGNELTDPVTAGLRAELDTRSESVGRKIRDAELLKIPYMLVVGEREAAAGSVAVRERSAGDVGVVAIEDFAARLQTETSRRSR